MGERKMTQLSGIPARWVDDLQLNRSDTASGYLQSAVAARLVSVIVFPVTAIVDSITNILSYAGQRAYSLLPVGADTQEAYRQSAYKAAISAWRHFAAFLATPSSVITPDVITHHFIPLRADANDELRPYGRLYAARGELKQPRTVREVQEIVNEARRTHRQVSITGAGFSQGKHILPTREENININLQKMNETRVNPRRKTITVGPGATWAEVQKAANEHGLAVQTMQASNVFSVGGSLGINCHGWDIHAGTLGNTVRSITIVDAHGEAKVVTREDELFRLIVGGIGMYGVIVSVELELTDNVMLERSGDVMRPTDYLAYFRQLQEDDSVDMHLAGLSLKPGHLFEEVVAENYRRKEGDEPHVAEMPEHNPEGDALDRIALQYARNRRWIRAAGWNAKKQDILTPKSATRNNHMDFPIEAMMNHSRAHSDWLQEYFVPPHQLNLFIQKLKEVLEKNDVPLYNASIRYVPQDESSEFAYAKDGEKFAIVLCFAQSMAPDQIEKTKKWVQEITDYLADHEGTYYLPYQQFATKEQFRACHPEWARGAELKRKYDPHNVFYSGFGEQYIDVGSRVDRMAGLLIDRGGSIDAPPVEAVRRGAEPTRPSFYKSVFGDAVKRAEFATFLRGIYQQVDVQPFFALIDDILEHATTDEEIYLELQRRMNEAGRGPFVTALRTINSLRDQIKAIGTQFSALTAEDESFDGYIELETPGRFVKELKQHRKITGRVTVVNTDRSAKDYIEAGFPLPFHEHVALDNYKPLSNRLENASVELVSCFKGLHHVNPDELEDFVKSIHRVLKPGGTFLLRDHNAESEHVFAIADVVHSLVNAANGESWDVEKAEVRNFHGLGYWQELMERNGFRLVSDGQMRDGDPTKNTLLRFEKIATDRDRALAERREALDAVEGYRGHDVGVSFQAAEWENVLAARRYAEVISRVPFYEFEFMKHLGEFWKVFGEAWNIERENHSLFELATSYYTYMILFVGINMTIEYSIKAAISAPLLWAFGPSDGRPLPIQMVIEDPEGRAQEIDERIEVKERLGDSNLYRIELRRFYEMKEFVERAAAAGIRPLELAGSKNAQLRLFIPAGQPEVLNGIDGLRPLFQWDDVENQEEKLAQVRVEIENLPEILEEFERRGIRLEFMHDLET